VVFLCHRERYISHRAPLLEKNWALPSSKQPGYVRSHRQPLFYLRLQRLAGRVVSPGDCV
jgi:hypothetical protein